MINKIFIVALIVSMFNMVYSQERIGTLYQMEECVNRPNHDEMGCPDLEDVTYVKDIDNRLDKFIGVWKGIYEDKTYEFRFDKKTKFGEYEIKWDMLIGRLLVKNSSNVVVYNSLNTSDSNTDMYGDNFQRNTYMFSWGSKNNSYCNDSGVIFVEVKKNNPNKMRLHFDRDKTIYNAHKCPNYSTYRTVIPENTELILTKQ